MKRLSLFDVVLADQLYWVKVGPGLLDFSLSRAHNCQLINALFDLVLELDAFHGRTRFQYLRALLPKVLLCWIIQPCKRILCQFGWGVDEQVLFHVSCRLSCIRLRTWSFKKTLCSQDRVFILGDWIVGFSPKILILIEVYLTFIMSDIRRLHSGLLLVLVRQCLHICLFTAMDGHQMKWFLKLFNRLFRLAICYGYILDRR